MRIIDDYIINKLKYNPYTVVLSKGKEFPCNGFNLQLEYDTAIFSNQKGSRKIDQNKIYLDFLTLKCTGREVKEKHYKNMINLLHKKNKSVDKVFFANRILSKINVQFYTGIKRFIFGNDGGLERVNNLRKDIFTTDFLSITPYPSNFCNYCILNDIFMGRKQTQKNIEVIE